ncbi:MAG: CPBP family intramembrane metalloprotease [Oscillibacter sp.]|nr:CPBP family intramembrane metalloprotease [Oscillibacter sp.]
MRKLLIAILVAALLWTIMFSPLTAHWVNFWYMMTASAATLAIYATCVRPQWWRQVKWKGTELLLGIGIAVALWSIFWIGDRIAVWLFDFARPQVDLIYGMKTGKSPWLLGELMLLLIGPAEEIFWRSYVQHTLSARYPPNKGFIMATLLYTLVHVASCNFMLIMAALVAGAVWGLCYRFFPNHLGAIILSHALWDVAVFVVFPI